MQALASSVLSNYLDVYYKSNDRIPPHRWHIGQSSVFFLHTLSGNYMIFNKMAPKWNQDMVGEVPGSIPLPSMPALVLIQLHTSTSATACQPPPSTPPPTLHPLHTFTPLLLRHTSYHGMLGDPSREVRVCSTCVTCTSVRGMQVCACVRPRVRTHAKAQKRGKTPRGQGRGGGRVDQNPHRELTQALGRVIVGHSRRRELASGQSLPVQPLKPPMPFYIIGFSGQHAKSAAGSSL